MKIPPFNDLVRLAQLNQDILLKEDREQELAEFFFNISIDELRMDYNNYVVKGIMKPGRDLFVSEVHRDVVDSYLDDVFLRVSLLKLMIAYDRFNPASRVLTALLRDRASLDYKSITIMDYGCGAADYAILFACFGCDVVVVDIEGAPIDLACFGLKKHSISRYSRNQRYPYPELPQVDIINATEVLEHVIDPPLMIERFAGALRRNGYLTFSDYSRRPKSVGGSHLQIAANKREQTLSTLNRFFVEIWADPSAGHLYKKNLINKYTAMPVLV